MRLLEHIINKSDKCYYWIVALSSAAVGCIAAGLLCNYVFNLSLGGMVPAGLSLLAIAFFLMSFISRSNDSLKMRILRRAYCYSLTVLLVGIILRIYEVSGYGLVMRIGGICTLVFLPIFVFITIKNQAESNSLDK